MWRTSPRAGMHRLSAANADRSVRSLDKLVDDLAKGKTMKKVLRV